jgi:hypothetical protein
MILRVVLVVMVALILARVVLLVLRRGKRVPHHTTADALSGIRGRDLKTLRNICRGDVERMSRLIEHEKNRRPGLNNQEACRRVIDGFARDNQ